MSNWLIVNYHYVHNSHDYPFKNLRGNTPEQFRRQVRALKEHFKVLTAGAVLADWCGSALADFYCTVCFDDGIKDIYDYALPILLEEGLKGTFFINSSPLEEKRLLSVQKIHLLMGELGSEEFRLRFMRLLDERQGQYQLNDLARCGIKHSYLYDTDEVAEFKMKLNFLLPCSLRDVLLNEIWMPLFGDESEIADKLYVRDEQIKEMWACGMEIGSHFHTHAVQALLPETEQWQEVQKGVALLKKYNAGMALFSYPFGGDNSWGQETLNAFGHYGVNYAFSMGRRMAAQADIAGKYTIPRFSTDDIFINKSDKFQEKIIQCARLPEYIL